jgi:pyruvate dehydrogenase E1 component beta subunit
MHWNITPTAPSPLCAYTGLKVVIPSTPHDAKGLMISAIESNDPVIFMEPKRVYRAIKQEVSERKFALPLGKARVVQEGTRYHSGGFWRHDP